MESGLCVKCAGTRAGAYLVILSILIALVIITFLYFFSWRPLFGKDPLPDRILNALKEKIGASLEVLEATSEGKESLSAWNDSLLALRRFFHQLMIISPKSLLGYVRILIGFWWVYNLVSIVYLFAIMVLGSAALK
jgi:hypothetical protein